MNKRFYISGFLILCTAVACGSMSRKNTPNQKIVVGASRLTFLFSSPPFMIVA